MNIIIHSNNEKIYKRTSITYLHTFDSMNEYFRKEGGGVKFESESERENESVKKHFPNY